ncbi:MAG: SoxR reducing system RseC family protein [Candidatus Omnitrophica bacterium]|nr:SoxR reducing system RseC family protein [Candidatus Omnitrophota bacterium]MCM8806593.1 SoxR reducing system RseC family protein [Candidatus Omnitrophota bacterium]
MIEKGKVIEIKGNNAFVLIEEKEKCKNCNLCKKIIPRQPIIEAENYIKANIGENVEIEINEDYLLKIFLYIYGIPLTGFILAALISYFLKTPFKIFIFLSILIIFWILGFKKGKKLSEEIKPKIIKKI